MPQFRIINRLLFLVLVLSLGLLPACSDDPRQRGSITSIVSSEEQNSWGGSGRPLTDALQSKVLLFQDSYTDSDEHKGFGSANRVGVYLPEYTMFFKDPNDDNKVKLLVSEWGNARTIIFNSPPTSDAHVPDVVVGQPDFSTAGSNSGGLSASSLSNHTSATVCGTGELIIPDYSNNRVLIYSEVPKTNGVSADVVIGQADFTSNSANQGGSVAANTLRGPLNAACKGGKLYISDASNNRILVFNTIPTTNNASADLVIGQPDFTSASESCSADGLYFPRTIMFDDSDRMYVSDPGNNRILVYNSIPTSNNPSASFVIGQNDMTSCSADQGGTPTASTLDRPDNFALSLDNGLAVSDRGNHRVLLYRLPVVSNGMAATGVIGQSNFTDGNGAPSDPPTEFTLNNPIGLNFQSNHIWIADQTNHRIMAVELPSY